MKYYEHLNINLHNLARHFISSVFKLHSIKRRLRHLLACELTTPCQCRIPAQEVSHIADAGTKVPVRLWQVRNFSEWREAYRSHLTLRWFETMCSSGQLPSGLGIAAVKDWAMYQVILAAEFQQVTRRLWFERQRFNSATPFQEMNLKDSEKKSCIRKHVGLSVVCQGHHLCHKGQHCTGESHLHLISYKML